MLAEGLLEKIGFTEEQRHCYDGYAAVFEKEIAPYTSAYFEGGLTFSDALEKVRSLHPDTVHEYTADLLFLLDCTGYVQEKYRRAGIADDVFVASMTDIRYKLNECLHCKGVFGTFVSWWYDKFFTLERFALGRLQYDVEYYHGEDLIVGDYVIRDGDLVLNCHIPSAGPLTHELCLRSYSLAYNFFHEKLRGTVLPILCCSWLLYPPYEAVFVEGSNTHDFVSDFQLLQVNRTDGFHDAWRVFGRDFDGNIDHLPVETGMQRRFVEYIRGGGSFGDAKGILLFDGGVLTKRQ